MPEKILILGGAGFIGSHTADRLLHQGHQVRVLDSLVQPVHPNREVPKYLDSNIEMVIGDVRDPDAIDSVLKGVDVVFHLAAYQDYHNDFSTFFDVNVTSTALLYERIVAREQGPRKVIVASSQFVQGEGLYKSIDGQIVSPGFRTHKQLAEQNWNHVDENGDVLTPIPTPSNVSVPTNSYGLSKRAQEETALVLGRRYGVPTSVLRYSIVQGPRQSRYNTYSGVCRIFVLHFLAGLSPTIFEDGEQERDFVNVYDVVDANMIMMNDSRTDGNVYSVAGKNPITINRFSEIAAEVCDRTDIAAKVPGLYRYGDARHCISDSSPLQELGWTGDRAIRDSVTEYRMWAEQEGGEIRDLLQQTMANMKTTGVVRK